MEIIGAERSYYPQLSDYNYNTKITRSKNMLLILIYIRQKNQNPALPTL